MKLPQSRPETLKHQKCNSHILVISKEIPAKVEFQQTSVHMPKFKYILGNSRNNVGCTFTYFVVEVNRTNRKNWSSRLPRQPRQGCNENSEIVYFSVRPFRLTTKTNISQGEISSKFSCRRKTKAKTWITTGEKSLRFSQRLCQQEFISKVFIRLCASRWGNNKNLCHCIFHVWVCEPLPGSVWCKFHHQSVHRGFMWTSAYLKFLWLCRCTL